MQSRRFIAICVLLAGMAILTSLAAVSLNKGVVAQGDVTAPMVVSIQIEPQEIDTSQGPQTIMVTARITDDLSGLYFADVRFVPEVGTTQVADLRFQVDPASEEPALDGIYTDTVTLPQYAAEGRWVISSVSTRDQVGNIQNVDDLTPYSQYFFVNGSAPEPEPTPNSTYLPAVVTSAQPDQGIEDNFPFILLEGVERCDPNADHTYFNGYVRHKDNSPMNGVCVHIAFYEPRGTKCSGCDGVGDGVWGFSPFGGPAPAGIPIEIFVVPCEGAMPMGGQTEQTGFGDLTPQSRKWTRTITQSEQCTGITFVAK